MIPVMTPLNKAFQKALKQNASGRRLIWFFRKPKVLEYSVLIPFSILMTGVKVLMHGKAYEREGFQVEDRRLLYTQEAIRQSISTLLWLGTLCFSYEFVVKKLCPNLSKMGQVLMSNLISQIPDTFVRPFVTAKLSKLFMEKRNTVASGKKLMSDSLVSPVNSFTRYSTVAIPSVKTSDTLPAQQQSAVAPGYWIPATANPLYRLYR